MKSHKMSVDLLKSLWILFKADINRKMFCDKNLTQIFWLQKVQIYAFICPIL